MDASVATDELPEDVLQLLHEESARRVMRRESFASAMCKKRDDAVNARVSSGIETQWEEDAEHYVGIDDANRGSTSAAGLKPRVSGGGESKKKGTTRSTVFLNVTRPYVDAIVARTCDILLPVDSDNWDIQPTPIPELTNKLNDKTPVPQAMPQMQAMPQQMPPPGMPPQGMPPQGMPPQAPPMQGMPPQGPQMPPPAPPVTVGDLAQKALSDARRAAEKAKKRISDWLTESKYNGEVRKAIHDAARIGVGIMKGPVPENRSSVAVIGNALVAVKEIKPASKRVDPWNFFPGADCNEDVHAASSCWERDYLTAKALRALKGLPGYLDDEIDACLEEGPTSTSGASTKSSLPSHVDSSAVFEVWYGYVDVEREDLASVMDELDDGDHFHSIITLVNGRVIKGALNPIDSGAYPYDVFAWQRIVGHWAGIGVSRQIRPSQKALNAAHRNCLDNAGLAGGPILILRRNLIQPQDGNWELRPRKIFYATEDADLRSVNDAILAVNVPSMQQELMTIMQFELQMCEQVTGFPLLMMGQAGNAAPDTYGGQMLATANASTVLRAIARNFDDGITIPHIGRYYQWLMMYSEADDEKGDFEIVARGSTALVEHEIQAQEQVQILQMAGNPAFGIDPKKAMAEWFKSRRFDPEKFLYSPEELAKQQQKPPQPPPAVQAAQIRSQASVEVAKINLQREIQKIQAEYEAEMQAAANGQMSPQLASAQAQIAAAKIRAEAEMAKEQYRSNSELAYAESQARMAMVNDQANMRELELKREIALLEYSAKHQLTLEQTKAQLATTAMQEQTKRQLAAAKYEFEKRDYGSDRDQDFEKHVQNIVSNQDSAAEARKHDMEKMREQHKHEMELQKQKLEEASKKAREAPGKRQ